MEQKEREIFNQAVTLLNERIQQTDEELKGLHTLLNAFFDRLINNNLSVEDVTEESQDVIALLLSRLADLYGKDEAIIFKCEQLIHNIKAN